MKKNDVLILKADNLGADFEGVCHAEGMAVFVPGILPGEQCAVRILKVADRYAFGKTEGEISFISADRRDPDCAVWPRCGGCSCRHMSYSATLIAKQQQVRDCFMRIAHIDVDVPAVIGMDNPYYYRNKTALPVSGTADNPCLGFFAPRTHNVIPVTLCRNAMEPSASIATAFLSYMKKNRIEPYCEETHTGLVRHLIIRTNRFGESMVTVVLNGNSIPDKKSLQNILNPLKVTSFIININTSRTNVILGDRFYPVFGSGFLEDSLCGLSFRLSPASFFQVNPQQTEKLYQTALEFAQLDGHEHVCDVYCGAGTISLLMAKHCDHVTGIEIVDAAIRNAKENALRNNITNADFFTGSAEVLLPRMVSDGLKPDVITVDPPRKGLDDCVINAIKQACPSRVVYVSCNVATQARDAQRLALAGYILKKVQPVDMFCWTSGVENVALFIKEKEG